LIRDRCVVEVNGDVVSALKELKRQVEAAGIQKELRKRACYSKPSEARTTKSRVARAKDRKAALRKQAWLAKQSG
jgi:ribosomal protein S21